jgi:hypothetical protein
MYRMVDLQNDVSLQVLHCISVIENRSTGIAKQLMVYLKHIELHNQSKNS